MDGHHVLRIDIVTVMPEMLVGPLDHGVIGRARSDGRVEVHVHNLRDWTDDRHRTTDDYAFGGGGGMVMKPEPLFRAVEDLLGMPPITCGKRVRPPCPIVLMTPQGRRFDHAAAQELAAVDRLLIVTGRYEGYDERVREHLATHEISIGDFVLTGGELPAVIVADAVARLRPGVVGSETATETDSFAHGLLEHPHYTRPAEFRGWSVPDVLLSGHHAEIEQWRRRESLKRTATRRPDLLDEAPVTPDEAAWLAGLPRPEPAKSLSPGDVQGPDGDTCRTGEGSGDTAD